MPRYSDRYGSNTRLYVGHLSSRTRSYDLEDIFSRYGRVRDVDMKRDYAFVDFSDPRDADDARHGLDGRDIDGSRVIVEFAKGVPRGPGGLRDHGGRGGPPPGSGRCFNCGIDGHWARDCKSGDWRNKCYKCGERGHIERNCQNSPKKPRRGRSYSRSPSPRRRSPSPRRDRSRTRSFSRSRSYSQSRSPPKRDRAVERVDRSRSPRVSRSPKRQRGSPVSSRGRKRTPSSPASRSPRRRGSPSRSPPRSPRHRGSPSRSPPRSPRHRGSPSRSPSRSPLRRGSRSPPRSPRHRGNPSRSPPCSPRHDEKRGNGSDYGGSPRLRSQSPIIERESPHNGNVRSPYEENGQDRSASPAARNDGRDVNDGDYGQASPAGSE